MALAGEPIGQILKGMGLITELDIQEALQEQKSKGGALGRILSDKGLVTDADLRVAIAKQAGMDPIDLDEVIVTSDLLDLVPAHVAETYQVVPVEFDGKVLTLALADPQNISALDDMKFMLNVEVKGALSDPESVERAMKKYYSDRTESMESLLGSMDQGEIEVLDDSRHDMMGHGSTGAGCQCRPGGETTQHGAAVRHQGPCIGYSPRTLREGIQDPLPGGRRALRDDASPDSAGQSRDLEGQGDGKSRYRRDPPTPGWQDRTQHLRTSGRPSCLHLADDVRRVGGDACAGPWSGFPRPGKYWFASERPRSAEETDHQAKRDHPGDGADRFGQDDDALLVPR